MEVKKLSRFAVEISMKCERCFVLQYKHKISLPSLPFTLNSAVDNLCKNEFDSYREKGQPHPIFIEHGIDAIPFAHDYAKGYQRQLEMYQWVYRKLGFEVADEAYLVYFNGKKNEPMFYQQLNFDLHVIKLECNDIWVEDAIVHARSLLMQETLPSASDSCEKCTYLKKRWQLAQKL